MSSSAAMQTVQDLKKALLNELEDGGDAGENLDTERCQDLLSRLDEQVMSLDVLTETLIGATVSKLKSHAQLGTQAKDLIKKWKRVAKGEQPLSNGHSKSAAHKSGQPKDDDSAPSLGISAANKLPPQRKNICEKIFQLLVLSKPEVLKAGLNAQAMDDVDFFAQPALEIEAAVQRDFSDRKAYTDKARSIAFNLKKNRDLCVQLLLGQIQPDELVHMSSEQLASAEQLKERAEQAKKLIDSKRLDWEQANEAKINEMCGIKGDLLQASLFTCARCKSTKTTSTQKQTRSADEPMTVFVLCLNCGKRWKFS